MIQLFKKAPFKRIYIRVCNAGIFIIVSFSIWKCCYSESTLRRYEITFGSEYICILPYVSFLLLIAYQNYSDSPPCDNYELVPCGDPKGIFQWEFCTVTVASQRITEVHLDIRYINRRCRKLNFGITTNHQRFWVHQWCFGTFLVCFVPGKMLHFLSCSQFFDKAFPPKSEDEWTSVPNCSDHCYLKRWLNQHDHRYCIVKLLHTLLFADEMNCLSSCKSSYKDRHTRV